MQPLTGEIVTLENVLPRNLEPKTPPPLLTRLSFITTFPQLVCLLALVWAFFSCLLRSCSLLSIKGKFMVSLYACSWWKVSERLHGRCHDCVVWFWNWLAKTVMWCATPCCVHFEFSKLMIKLESYRGKSKQFCNDCREKPKPLLTTPSTICQACFQKRWRCIISMVV